MSKLILTKNESREKLIKGVNVVADIVKSTLGPKGKNVIIQRPSGTPLVTNDGATIAKEISLKDGFEDLGAKMIIESSSGTNKEAGDGTTTTAVLAQSLINKGVEAINNGTDPIDLRKGMNEAVNKLTKRLAKMSKKVEGRESIKKIATISSGNENIGELIAEAYDKIGENGAITTEDSKTNKTMVEVKNGYRLYKGMVSPYLFDQGKTTLDLNDAGILVTSNRVESLQQIAGVLTEVSQQGGSLVIFAESFSDSVIELLIVNRLRGLQVFAVEASGYGKGKIDTLSDVAIATGAKFFNSEQGMRLNEATINDLGLAKQVKINSDLETLVINGAGDLEAIKSRILEINDTLENDKNLSENDQTRLRNRIANLSNGVAIISVGASSSVELEELKLRIEDALCSVRSSLEEGIVPGAGATFINLAKSYKFTKGSQSFELGQQIVLDSISSLLEQILINADYSEDRIKDIMETVKNKNMVYNLEKDRFERYGKTLVFDPTKVERVSLEKSVSIASTLLTTDSAIIIEPEDKTQYIMQSPMV